MSSGATASFRAKSVTLFEHSRAKVFLSRLPILNLHLVLISLVRPEDYPGVFCDLQGPGCVGIVSNLTSNGPKTTFLGSIFSVSTFW